jgi:hypothetical protein
MTNPLSQYFHTPKAYAQLPTRGKFYTSDFLTLAVNGEIAVYPLTAIDQIMLKTPDAMLNGDALLSVFRNCVPGVKDPKKLVEPDINTLLVAIRIASSGPTMEVDTKCPSCGKEHNFGIDLSVFIETQSYVDGPCYVEIDGALQVFLRPYNFEQRNLQLLNEVEQARSIRTLEETDTTDAEKISSVTKQVSRMAQRTLDIMAMSITEIKIISSGELVTNQEYIQEFVTGIPTTSANAIIDKLKELNKTGIDTETSFQCDGCSHTWSQSIDFDPTSFFD